MDSGREAFPGDIEALKVALVAARDDRIAEAARAVHAEAELAVARAKASDDQALIAHLKLQIEKLNRDRYGPRSERTARLLDQLELTLEELEASATEDELAAEMAAARITNTTTVASFTRQRPSRKPFPDHLPRERVIVSGPPSCACCGGCTVALTPLFLRLEAHVLSAERLHGDDTTVPVLAKGKTSTGRIWVYVRDNKPFGGPEPPGAVFYYSRDRAGEHPQAHLASYSGIFQADAYRGYCRLYHPGRNGGPLLVHARPGPDPSPRLSVGASAGNQ